MSASVIPLQVDKPMLIKLWFMRHYK